MSTFLKFLAALAVTLPDIIKLLESIFGLPAGATMAAARTHAKTLSIGQ